MKSLKSLSKEELLSFIYNSKNKIDITEKQAACIICHDSPYAKYWYCCDKCNKLLGEE